MTDYPEIEGLTIRPNAVSYAHAESLLNWVDTQEWDTRLKRRTQHYGWRYDYTAKTVSRDSYLGDLPDNDDRKASLRHFADVVAAYYELPRLDQCIVNEYLPGQGIGFHVDCEPCFGEHIVTLSLGGHCTFGMRTIPRYPLQEEAFLLFPNTLMIMSGKARHLWLHGIPARKTDQYHGDPIKRERRVSLTFRTVVFKDAK